METQNRPIVQVSIPAQVESNDCQRTLRQGGLFRLPDGTEVVVGVGRNSHYFLYHPRVWLIQAWVVSLPVSFEICSDGSLLTGKGTLTNWSIKDLIDTGITPEKI